jgi:hypothetical protein
VLRFQPGVTVSYWNPRLGPILEYASAWGALRGRCVDVDAIEDSGPSTSPSCCSGFTVWLSVGGGTADDLTALQVFLSRLLPLEFEIIRSQFRVRTEWRELAARRPTSTPAARATPAPV